MRGIGEHNVRFGAGRSTGVNQLSSKRNVGVMQLSIIPAVGAGEVRDCVDGPCKFPQPVWIVECVAASYNHFNFGVGKQERAQMPAYEAISAGNAYAGQGDLPTGLSRYPLRCRRNASRTSGSARSRDSTSFTSRRRVLCEV